MAKPDWDRYAHLKNLQPVLDPKDHGGFKNCLIDQIHWRSIQEKLKGARSLLDFGCGIGRFTARIVREGIQYKGIDNSAGMIEAAKKIHPEIASSFLHFDGVHIPFRDNFFDTFFSCGVFQYILGSPDCDKVLSEIRRVLMPGGRFCMLEQASASQQMSGTVSRVSTESDYHAMMSKHFHVKSISRIRSGALSGFSCRIFRAAPFIAPLYFQCVGWLANLEIKRIQKMTEAGLRTIPYYDILIEGEAFEPKESTERPVPPVEKKRPLFQMDPAADLKQISFYGLSWGMAANLIRQFLTFAIGVILARVLDPAAFGLLGMALFFTGMSNILVGQGVGSVIIQKQDLEHRHLDTLFWINIVSGVLCALFFVMASSWIARFYNEPLLQPLIRVFAVIFVINAFNIVPSALLNKKIESRKLALIDTAAVVCAGGAGIFLALSGWGVWSLVWQAIVLACVTAVLTGFAASWRPRFHFDFSAAKEIANYTLPLAGFGSLSYLERNLDNFLIGKFISTEALGLYSRAYQLMMMPLTQVSGVAARVFFPLLSAIQQDKDKAKRIYLQANRGIALVTFPLMMGLLVVSRPFILCFFGVKWSGTILLLQILSLEGMVQSLSTTVGWIYNSQGRTDLQLRFGVISTLVTLSAFVIGLRWGVVGIAVAYVLTEVLLFYPTWAIPGAIINLRVPEMLKNLQGPFFCAAGMAGVISLAALFLPENWEAWQFLGVEVSLGIVTYMAFIHLFKIRAYEEMKELILGRGSRRRA